MSNYSVLKQDINNNIYENQTQQITGTVLNAILNEMTASLGAGYQFAGVATLGMNPGDPDQRVFYLAGEGIYTNFGGLQVPQGKLGVLKWDFRWTLQTIDGLGGGGANLTGYVSLASTDDLPEEGQPTLGYLCGTNLYLYVGTGGDTKEGKYQNCGSFRGPQGLQGDPGVGIATVAQTTTSTEDEGINVITVTKEDGTQSTFQVRNGSKGSQGIQGPQGVQGEPGRLQAQYKEVETLPTASADTVDYIYLVASQTPNTYDMYYTEENQGAYSWKSLGTTAVQLSDYATKAEVNQLEAKLYSFGGMLVPLLKKIAYKDDNAQQYVNAIDVLLNNDELESISAAYTQPGIIYAGEPLEDLEDGLVVTAHYTSGNDVVVTGYTLSGTLVAGTSPITVTYLEKTTTFNVNVTDALYYKDGSLFAPQVSTRNTVTKQTLATSYERDGVTYVFANSYAKGGGTTAEKRCSYYLFDILVTAGKNYKYIFELDEPLGANQTILAAITYYNETFRQAGVANAYAAADHSGDANATSWISGTKDGNYLSFEDVAQAGYVGGRMTLKLQVSGTDSAWPGTITIKRFIVQELS